MMNNVLPDVLQPDMKVVFCGTAAGNLSAALSAYYAKPGNKFWEVLYRIGLTPHRIEPQNFRDLAQYGIGLTDLAKHTAGMDHTLKAEDFNRELFIQNITSFAPQVIAFTSKKTGQVFYASKKISFGRQPTLIGKSTVFVLPSTSGAANKTWNIAYWQEVADFIKSHQ